MPLFSSLTKALLGERTGGFYATTGESGLSPITVEAARRNATVSACVDSIARSVAQLRFTAADRPMNGPVNRLLQRPNDWMAPYPYWHGVVEDMMFHGNAVSRLVRGSSTGRPQFFVPLDPEYLAVSTDDLGRPLYKSIEYSGALGRKDVIHVRDAGGHGLWGASRIQKAGRRIMALNYADELIQDTFENGITAQYWVELEGRIGAEGGAKALGSTILKAFGRKGSRRGGVMVMDPNQRLHKMEGLKPADAELRALRQDLIREIAAQFGTPPFRVGGTGDTKYSNFSASMLTFYRDTIVPVVTNIVQAYTLALGTEIRCDTSGLLEGDLKTQIDTALRGAGVPVITPNEGRQMAGYERIEGRPELDEIQLNGSTAEMPPGEGDRAGETPTDDGATDAEGELDQAA